jgi:ADP-ribose pyrophosphatase YjhB (NUDIX family)
VLTSGNHGAVDEWRRRARLERTEARRPDLLQHAHLTAEERRALTGDPGFAQVRVGDTIFQVRVAAVCVASDGRVLLHRTVGSEIWSLPGGRLRVGERVEDAVRREMREETGGKVEPGEVLWVYENFAEHASAVDGPGGGAPLPHHEIGVYVAASVPARFERRDSFGGSELAGTPDEFKLEFRWFRLDEVGGLDVRPAGVVPALLDHVASSGTR